MLPVTMHVTCADHIYHIFFFVFWFKDLFSQLCNNQRFLDSKRLKLFLQQMILVRNKELHTKSNLTHLYAKFSLKFLVDSKVYLRECSLQWI